jgi:hypothetical protein
MERFNREDNSHVPIVVDVERYLWKLSWILRLPRDLDHESFPTFILAVLKNVKISSISRFPRFSLVSHLVLIRRGIHLLEVRVTIVD